MYDGHDNRRCVYLSSWQYLCWNRSPCWIVKHIGMTFESLCGLDASVSTDAMTSLFSKERSNWWLTDAFIFCTYFPGSHPELHSCWRCCSGDCSRVHADALWCSDRRILLWYNLHTGIYLPHGMVFIWFIVLDLLWDRPQFSFWKCSSIQAVSYRNAPIKMKIQRGVKIFK